MSSVEFPWSPDVPTLYFSAPCAGMLETPNAAQWRGEVMSDNTISILVATDSPILRDALSSIIKAAADLKLAGATENQGEIISRARELCPSLVILDTSF